MSSNKLLIEKGWYSNITSSVRVRVRIGSVLFLSSPVFPVDILPPPFHIGSVDTISLSSCFGSVVWIVWSLSIGKKMYIATIPTSKHFFLTTFLQLLLYQGRWGHILLRCTCNCKWTTCIFVILKADELYFGTCVYHHEMWFVKKHIPVYIQR